MLCENTKNYKYTYTGSNKVVCRPYKQSEILFGRKNKSIFEYAKLDFCKKKIVNAKKKKYYPVFRSVAPL